MKKLLSLVMILAFWAGGTAGAQYAAAGSGNPGVKSHPHKQHSKKSKAPHKKRAGKGKKGKGKKGKGSKAKGEVKMENGTVGKSDLEIDLKGQ